MIGIIRGQIINWNYKLCILFCLSLSFYHQTRRNLRFLSSIFRSINNSINKLSSFFSFFFCQLFIYLATFIYYIYRGLFVEIVFEKNQFSFARKYFFSCKLLEELKTVYLCDDIIFFEAICFGSNLSRGIFVNVQFWNLEFRMKRRERKEIEIF